MADGLPIPTGGANVATEDYAGATRLPGYHRQETVPAIAGAAGAPASVNVTTSSTTLAASNGLRVALWLYNNSDSTVWLAFGQAASANSGLPLLSGALLAIDESWQGDVRAVHAATGNKAVTVQELSA